jgi:hypothetical protein
MKIIALVLGWALLGATASQAQQAAKDLKSLPILPQPLPSGDLISQAPDSSHWSINSTIITTAPTDASGAAKPDPTAPKPAVLNITKSGKIYLVESVSPDGKKMTRWKNEQFQATYPPEVSSPSIAFNSNAPNYVDFSKSDFPEFTWISAKNYVGMTKLGAAMGLVFKGSVPIRGARMALLSMQHPNPSDAIAVVDLNTHMPLMLQVGDEILVYQFTSGGTDVTLPPDVHKAFDLLRTRIQNASAVPPG